MASVRGATLLGPDKLEVREYPMPDIPADGGLIKIEMGGVCGTDVKYLHGKLKVDYPIILGHEILGRVEKLGKNAAAIHHVKEGDRVILKGALGCGRCADCRRNNQRFCRQRTNYGGRTKCDKPPHLFGGFADYLYLAPDVLCTKVSDVASRRSGRADRLGDGQRLSMGDPPRRRQNGRLRFDPRPRPARTLLHLCIQTCRGGENFHHRHRPRQAAIGVGKKIRRHAHDQRRGRRCRRSDPQRNQRRAVRRGRRRVRQSQRDLEIGRLSAPPIDHGARRLDRRHHGDTDADGQTRVERDQAARLLHRRQRRHGSGAADHRRDQVSGRRNGQPCLSVERHRTLHPLHRRRSAGHFPDQGIDQPGDRYRR